MNIGDAIKKLRQENGIKQNFIADKAGISKEYLSNIESGNRQPTLQSLAKICDALNVSVPYLLLLASEDLVNKIPDDKLKDLRKLLTLAKDI